jgi:MFS family permease
MGLFMGALADRVNRTRLIAFGLGLWSILTAVSGAARGFVSLAVPRMFIGVGESILTPASISLIGDRFPARWRGLAVGVFGAGVPIGIAGSMFVVAYLEPYLGWRGCFYALGGLGVVLAMMMLLIKETPRHQVMTPIVETGISLPEIIKTLKALIAASPALGYTVLGSIIFAFVLGAGTFEQLWFVEERGFDRTEVARITAWMAISGGVIGNFIGGVGGDLFLRWTGIGRPTFLALVMIILAPINIAYRLVDGDSIWFLIGIFTVFFQLGCFYGPAFATMQDLVPANARGMMTGFLVLMIQLAGVGIGVTSGGVLIDWLQSSGSDSPYSTALFIFTLISLISIPLFLMAGYRFERDRQAVQAKYSEKA